MARVDEEGKAAHYPQGLDVRRELRHGRDSLQGFQISHGQNTACLYLHLGKSGFAILV